jgi:hypothetical protein
VCTNNSKSLNHRNDGLFLSHSSKIRYKFPVSSVIPLVTLLGVGILGFHMRGDSDDQVSHDHLGFHMVTSRVYKSSQSYYVSLRVCSGPQQTRPFSLNERPAEISTLGTKLQNAFDIRAAHDDSLDGSGIEPHSYFSFLIISITDPCSPLAVSLQAERPPTDSTPADDLGPRFRYSRSDESRP